MDPDLDADPDPEHWFEPLFGS
jgi:hypothetical protein